MPELIGPPKDVVPYRFPSPACNKAPLGPTPSLALVRVLRGSFGRGYREGLAIKGDYIEKAAGSLNYSTIRWMVTFVRSLEQDSLGLSAGRTDLVYNTTEAKDPGGHTIEVAVACEGESPLGTLYQCR